jgi:ABC-type lipoprotein release transport system permease subunit
MKEDLKIAWRNLWRNKRRTMITSSSVFFAVFFAVIMRSYQLGSYDSMILNFIESYSGYMQVQNVKYQDNPSVDYSFDFSDSLSSTISGISGVVSVSPHIESFALASNGTQSKGVGILAIDPEMEKHFSNPEKKLVKYRITREAVDRLRLENNIPQGLTDRLENNIGRAYSSKAKFELESEFSSEESKLYLASILKICEISNGFLTNDDSGVLVSDRLASYLHLHIGDTVILMGQGYHGASAAGVFPVRGIIKMPSPEIDNKLVIMTIKTAGEYFDLEGKITSLSINLTSKSPRVMREVQNKINNILPDKNTVVKTWEELNPVLVQQIQGDSQTGIATLAMLYFIIFFGIFGTVLMMIAERKREFGVLVAIGMQKRRLKKIVTIEMILLGILGLLGGLMASAPVIIYFNYNPILLKGDLAKMMEDFGWEPIMPAAWFGPYYYWQAIVVCIMVLLATIYPLRKIGKLKEIDALRS